MTNPLSRRSFVQSGALLAAAGITSNALPSLALQPSHATGASSPIQLGLASYTFRNFTRDQMIGFMKQLNITNLNVKDIKDHLPVDPTEEAKALADYTAAGIKLHAAGAIYFPKDDDADIRSKFEYCKRAGISLIVAGDPSPETLPRVEKFVKEYDIRIAIHNHGPEDKLWHSPLDILKAVKNMDPRIGCCIDVGHTVRAGTDVVQAIHEVGPRLFDVHMKDLTNFDSKESQVAVGDGIMPVRGIFEALIKTKYQGFVDLEYEVHADDPMPGVIASFSYMRGVLAGMGYLTHG
ncbi:sugar phosphate isomerase/epimerase family protein [Tunturibacter empetritectus]|uniref:Sugar phosphate isomerase/epimerase n=1 Tax=Tunturiibacter lichenicola TaxID=2051959 RepID=A0A7W8J876_9BACT|nr:sugar phosphate isomerase/epimerase [Edaphobacter lichenicola]MBB5344306.1 sugar phosphate isomerase/epimerase [Edaphobacter lichenicola]